MNEQESEMPENIEFGTKVKSVTHDMKSHKVRIVLETDETALVEATELSALADSGRLNVKFTPQQVQMFRNE